LDISTPSKKKRKSLYPDFFPCVAKRTLSQTPIDKCSQNKKKHKLCGCAGQTKKKSEKTEKN
jgi:hypothetical protein